MKEAAKKAVKYNLWCLVTTPPTPPYTPPTTGTSPRLFSVIPSARQLITGLQYVCFYIDMRLSFAFSVKRQQLFWCLPPNNNKSNHVVVVNQDWGRCSNKEQTLKSHGTTWAYKRAEISFTETSRQTFLILGTTLRVCYILHLITGFAYKIRSHVATGSTYITGENMQKKKKEKRKKHVHIWKRCYCFRTLQPSMTPSTSLLSSDIFHLEQLE